VSGCDAAAASASAAQTDAPKVASSTWRHPPMMTTLTLPFHRRTLTQGNATRTSERGTARRNVTGRRPATAAAQIKSDRSLQLWRPAASQLKSPRSGPRLRSACVCPPRRISARSVKPRRLHGRQGASGGSIRLCPRIS